jgi:hypothetical protein
MKGALRRIFGPKREKWPKDGEDCKMRNFMTVIPFQTVVLFGLSN